jgi:uncharacterized protein YndB with AHSA1/START domain
MTETVSPRTAQSYRTEIRIQAPPDAVFDAFTTVDGIAGRWTEQVSGSGAERSYVETGVNRAAF